MLVVSLSLMPSIRTKVLELSIPLKYNELGCPTPPFLEKLTPESEFKASLTVLNFLSSISCDVITSTLEVTSFNFCSDFVALVIEISSKVVCEYKFVAIKKLATKLTFIFFFFIMSITTLVLKIGFFVFA